MRWADDVGEFDVVHDDEAVEEGDEAGDAVRRRSRGGGLRGGFGGGEDVGVALDAALGVEEEVVVAVAGGERWMELVTMPLSQRTRSRR